RAGHGTDLDQRRPRERPRHGIVPPFAADPCRRLANESLILAMQRHQKTRLRGRAERGHQIFLMQRWKFGDAAVAEKSLDSDRASLAQLAQALRIGIDKAAPETEVADGGFL